MKNLIKMLLTRLIFSVALPTGVIVASMYIFHSLGDMPIIVATVMAFATGYFSMYLIFKYWINLEVGQETPHQQLMRYMIVFVINVAINAEIVYFLTTFAYVPILTAQAIAAVIVAYESFYAYRSLVFYTNSHTVAQVLAADVAPIELRGQ